MTRRCFRTRLVERIPSEPQALAVFAVLTNGSGIFKITVRISRAESDQTVYERQFSVTFANRLQEVRFFVRISHLRFPATGEYLVELYAEDDPLGMCTLKVRIREGHDG